jgi:hypothetical protein
MTFQHVLVAIDGSECAAHALEVAASLAAAVGAQIGVVHVIDPRLVGSETGVPADQQWAILRTDAKALLDTAASALAGPAPCWKFVREGTPWTEIVESARTWPADLLVGPRHEPRGPAWRPRGGRPDPRERRDGPAPGPTRSAAEPRPAPPEEPAGPGGRVGGQGRSGRCRRPAAGLRPQWEHVRRASHGRQCPDRDVSLAAGPAQSHHRGAECRAPGGRAPAGGRRALHRAGL